MALARTLAQFSSVLSDWAVAGSASPRPRATRRDRQPAAPMGGHRDRGCAGSRCTRPTHHPPR
jgi:hypothetical protein